jgi:cell division septation protein DedD
LTFNEVSSILVTIGLAFSEGISMKENNHERPGKDNSEEVPIFPDRDLEDYLKVEEEYPNGDETAIEPDPSPQTLASLKRQRRSKRSLILVTLLCFGLGILVVAAFFLMKPEVRKPQIVAKRMKRPIPPNEREEEPKILGAVEKKEGGEKPLEGGISEEEKLNVPKPPETPLVSRERSAEKKVIIIGGTEVLEGEEREKGTEAEGKVSDSEKRPEVKTQFAKAETPEIQAKPEEKLPIGRFTINVGSFREKVRAERVLEELKDKGYKAFVTEATISQRGTWYRVSVGRFPSRGEAQAFAQVLKEKEGIDSFVRELKEAKR